MFFTETHDKTGDLLWNEFFPINTLKVFKYEKDYKKINMPKIKYDFQSNILKKKDIEIEVLS